MIPTKKSRQQPGRAMTTDEKIWVLKHPYFTLPDYPCQPSNAQKVIRQLACVFSEPGSARRGQARDALLIARDEVMS